MMERHGNAKKSSRGPFFKNDKILIESVKDKLRNGVKPIEICNEVAKNHDSINHESESLSDPKIMYNQKQVIRQCNSKSEFSEVELFCPK